MDFDDGNDYIAFDSSIADEFSDLTIANDVNGDAHVTVGTVDITVIGIDSTDLTSGDFMFV